MLVCRLDLPNGLSLAVDRIADRRVAFIKQRWKAGPYRGSSTAAAGQDTLHVMKLQHNIGQCREPYWQFTRCAAQAALPTFPRTLRNTVMITSTSLWQCFCQAPDQALARCCTVILYDREIDSRGLVWSAGNLSCCLCRCPAAACDSAALCQGHP